MEVSTEKLEADYGRLSSTIEGYQKFLKVGQANPATDAVQNQLTPAERRAGFIMAAKKAIDILEADGYPNPLPPSVVSDAILADLEDDVSDMSQALADGFDEAIAVGGDFEPGPEGPIT